MSYGTKCWWRSQRAVARELGLARVTVRRYLEQAAPVRRPEATPRRRPVWDAVRDRVTALLTESPQWTGGKRRLTATLHELLLAEGHRVGVTVIRQAVAARKRQRREVPDAWKRRGHLLVSRLRVGDVGMVQAQRALNAGRRLLCRGAR